jgi:hypothetical protein
MGTNVSEKHAASVFYCENEGSRFSNTNLPDYIESIPDDCNLDRPDTNLNYIKFLFRS